MSEERVTEVTATVETMAEQEHLREELYSLHARFCRGLGDPKRLLIIAALRDGEKTVGQLTEAVGARQANISQHLALMRDLGLVVARRADNNVCYRLSDRRIVEAVDLLRAVQADQQQRRSTSFANGLAPTSGHTPSGTTMG